MKKFNDWKTWAFFSFCLFGVLLIGPNIQGQGRENIAFGKPVTASGDLWGAQLAGNLTDGDLVTFGHPLNDGTEFQPTLGFFYEIDLDDEFDLGSIELLNRTGCCPERLTNVQIDIYADDRDLGDPESTGTLNWTTDLRIDGSHSGDGGRDVLTSELDPEGFFNGRYVRITNLSGAPYNPQIAEVEIYSFSDEIAIIDQPTSSVVELESSATFNVNAIGPGELAYQWFKDGSEIAGANEASYTISNAMPEDEGDYYVVISNDEGSAPVTSETVTLTVTGVNIARWGVASQSTVGWDGLPSKAIDGNTSGVFPEGSITHTGQGDPTPWLEIHLFGPSFVESIALWNRTDCCSERLTNFKLSAFALDESCNPQLIFEETYFDDNTFPVTTETPFTIELEEEGVSSIRIERLGTPEDYPGQFFLSLAEVQIFGEGPEPGDVQECPAEGDTHCLGLTITPPEEGGPGTYSVTAEASDDDNDGCVQLSYTFTAERLEDGFTLTVGGPEYFQNEAEFNILGPGTWKISATVDDESLCPDVADDATCSEMVEIDHGNVAFGKEVFASGELWAGFPASNLTDGNLTTLTHPLNNGSLEQPTLDFFFEIDLVDSYEIDRIELVNRDNCCPER